jgi:hypothetical protein
VVLPDVQEGRLVLVLSKENLAHIWIMGHVFPFPHFLPSTRDKGLTIAW